LKKDEGSNRSFLSHQKPKDGSDKRKKKHYEYPYQLVIPASKVAHQNIINGVDINGQADYPKSKHFLVDLIVQLSI
jgi:hypothetical protein